MKERKGSVRLKNKQGEGKEKLVLLKGEDLGGEIGALREIETTSRNSTGKSDGREYRKFPRTHITRKQNEASYGNSWKKNFSSLSRGGKERNYQT